MPVWIKLSQSQPDLHFPNTCPNCGKHTNKKAELMIRQSEEESGLYIPMCKKCNSQRRTYFNLVNTSGGIGGFLGVIVALSLVFKHAYRIDPFQIGSGLRAILPFGISADLVSFLLFFLAIIGLVVAPFCIFYIGLVVGLFSSLLLWNMIIPENKNAVKSIYFDALDAYDYFIVIRDEVWARRVQGGLARRNIDDGETNISNVVNFFGADLDKIELLEDNFFGADLREADFRGAYFKGKNLKAANFEKANLKAANLSRANLTGANLCGTDLSETDFNGTNLTAANLTEADLREAQNITLKQIKLAKNWDKAIYSQKFKEKLGLT